MTHAEIAAQFTLIAPAGPEAVDRWLGSLSEEDRDRFQELIDGFEEWMNEFAHAIIEWMTPKIEAAYEWLAAVGTALLGTDTTRAAADPYHTMRLTTRSRAVQRANRKRRRR